VTSALIPPSTQERTRALIVWFGLAPKDELAKWLGAGETVEVVGMCEGTEAFGRAIDEHVGMVVIAVGDSPDGSLDLVRALWARAPGLGAILVAKPGVIDRADAIRAGALDTIEIPPRDRADAMLAAPVAELEKRRRLLLAGAQAARGPATTEGGSIVTVVSAKGGVGRSFVAANLAACLAVHARTCLCDLDLEGAEVSTWGADGSNASVDQLAAVLRTGELAPQDVAAVAQPRFGGVSLLPGPQRGAGLWAEHDGTFSLKLVRAVRQWYPWVVVDTPAGTIAPAPAIAAASTILVVVSGGDIGNLRATKRYLELLDGANPVPRIVVINRSDRGEDRKIVRAALPPKEFIVFVKDDRNSARHLVVDGRAAPQQGRRGAARAFRDLAGRVERAAARLAAARA